MTKENVLSSNNFEEDSLLFVKNPNTTISDKVLIIKEFDRRFGLIGEYNYDVSDEQLIAEFIESMKE